VCNSNMNCHCEVGWAPPDCRYAGHGGSVDSTDPVRVALLVIFFFVLPVVLLFLMLRFPRCRRALLCLREGSPFHKRRQHNRFRSPPNLLCQRNLSPWTHPLTSPTLGTPLPSTPPTWEHLYLQAFQTDDLLPHHRNRPYPGNQPSHPHSDRRTMPANWAGPERTSLN
ncbi:hypothetical protein CRUP_016253, partial [Coryphaenoides rupestris]